MTKRAAGEVLLGLGLAEVVARVSTGRKRKLGTAATAVLGVAALDLRVELRYDPPGGRLGAAIAKVLGDDPGRQVDGDLRRLKQVMETGERATSGADR